jgi:hypothetical protein
VIVQTSSGGANLALCREERKSISSAGVTQSCSITQTNSTGSNTATTYQELELNGDQVTGEQIANVTQANGSGANRAEIVQKLIEDASSGHKTVSQDQTGDQHYDILQTAATGANTADAKQFTTQVAKAPAAVSGTQTQHANLVGELDQSSSGVSTMTSTQDETQTARSKQGGSVAVTQVGPEDCCSSQLGNANNSFEIHQIARQIPGGIETQHGHYASSGDGTLTQSYTTPDETQTNVASGSVVNETNSCTEGECTQTGGDFEPGDLLVSVGDGEVQQWRSVGGTWTLLQTLDTVEGGETTGLEFGGDGNLYVTAFTANKVIEFDQSGNLVGAFASGLNAHPESVVFDLLGNAYVGHADGNADIVKFDASGAVLASYNVAVEDRGSDHIDLAPDQCTMLYTSEGVSVKRFDVCTNTQLSDFATGLPRPLFGVRRLADGGVVVAATAKILRLNAAGAVVQEYDFAGDDLWFSVELDPSGTAFWAGDMVTGHVVKFDLATGGVLAGFTTGGATNSAAGGIAVR